MKIEDKFVSIKVPKELHQHLREKAKKVDMTLGNYLFESISKTNGIKNIPAKVE